MSEVWKFLEVVVLPNPQATRFAIILVALVLLGIAAPFVWLWGRRIDRRIQYRLRDLRVRGYHDEADQLERKIAKIQKKHRT